MPARSIGSSYQAAVLRRPLRPVLQVAGDPPPRRIDQQVDRIVLDVLRQPVLDGEHQRGKPPAANRSDRLCASAWIAASVCRSSRPAVDHHRNSASAAALTASSTA